MKGLGGQPGWTPPAGASPWSLRSSRYWVLACVIAAMCLLPRLLGAFVPTGNGASSELLILGTWLSLVVLAWPLGRWLGRRWREAPPSRANFLFLAMPMLAVIAQKDGLLVFLLSVTLPAVPMLLLALGLGLHHRDRV